MSVESTLQPPIIFYFDQTPRRRNANSTQQLAASCALNTAVRQDWVGWARMKTIQVHTYTEQF